MSPKRIQFETALIYLRFSMLYICVHPESESPNAAFKCQIILKNGGTALAVALIDFHNSRDVVRATLSLSLCLVWTMQAMH